MKWDEVDFERAIWSIPRERVKNKRAHEVPISSSLVNLLSTLPRVSDEWVFSSNGLSAANNYSRNKYRLDEIVEVKNWTLHDLRRTFATGLARMGIQLHVIEKILNHQSGSLSGVAAIYNRHSFAEEKREAMEKWAKFVLDLTPARRPGQAQ